tara:strand:+ start:176 stop:325 length:150 start_codon:yes stop_codon:yes gene_type:complete
MDTATYLVAIELLKLMESDPKAKLESVQHNDWFNGMVDHLIEYEKAVLA